MLAVLTVVRQQDYKTAVINDDPSSYTLCDRFLSCCTPPANNRSTDNPSNEAARKLAQESGYNGEKVVIISPADFPAMGTMGQITTSRCSSVA